MGGRQDGSRRRTRRAWSGASFVSRWLTVDQARIDAFAKITEDEQFIHVDPERAAETAFGGTVAHGFLTLSLLSAMAYSALPRIEGAAHGVNYGFDRVRFVRPVPSGSRVRGHFTLRAVTPRSAREWQLTYDVSVEIEGAAEARAGGDLAHDAGDGRHLKADCPRGLDARRWSAISESVLSNSKDLWRD